MLRRITNALAGAPESVPADLLVAFPDLGEMRLRRGGMLPRLGGWFLGQRSVAGITIGRVVFVGVGVPSTAELLLHELAHVRQFQALSVFPLRYWWATLTRGYVGNRYEVEARRFAATRLGARPSCSEVT